MGAGHVFTGRVHGDLAVNGDLAVLAQRRSAVPGVPAVPWAWVRQVHGAGVLVVSRPGDDAGAEADAIITTRPAVPVAVHTADCAPLLVVADGGLAVVHAGWRGLLAGVVAATIEKMRSLGLQPERAVLGPVIRPRCYEFSDADIAPLEGRFGPAVRSTTAWGTTALDLPAAVGAAVGEHGLDVEDGGTCTACSPAHWSHRARGDKGRQALVAWITA